MKKYHLRVKNTVPHEVAVAVSGGADSMAALDFLRRPGRDILVLHMNHGTSFADEAQSLVERYCSQHDIPLVVGLLDKEMAPGRSKEDFWRENRYEFFEANRKERKVVTCHHLGDAVENWLFTCMHGNPALIPEVRGPYIRPFLHTEKMGFIQWCERKGVPFIEDPSNTDTSYMRNYIRHEMMPKVLKVNPGIKKTVRKLMDKRRVYAHGSSSAGSSGG